MKIAAGQPCNILMGSNLSDMKIQRVLLRPPIIYDELLQTFLLQFENG